MNRLWLWCVLPAALGSAAAFADEAAIREKLRSRVQVKFDQTPLHEVLKNLGEQAGVTFWIDEHLLEYDDTLRKEKTIDLGRMQLGSAIQILLDEKCAIIVGDHDVRITDAEGPFRPKVYFLTATLDALQQHPLPIRGDAAWLRLRLISSAWWMRPHQSDTVRSYLYNQVLGTIDPLWLERKSMSRWGYANQLSGLFPELVDNCLNGGCEGPSSGSMQVCEDALVVNTSVQLHEEIAVLLDAINSMLTAKERPERIWAIRTDYSGDDDEAVRIALEQNGRIHVAEQTLKSVLEELLPKIGVPFLIDYPAIDTEFRNGTNWVEARINQSSEQLPWNQILNRVLRDTELEYLVHEGVLIVTCQGDGSQSYFEREYLAVYDTSGIPESTFLFHRRPGFFDGMSNSLTRNRLTSTIESMFHPFVHQVKISALGSTAILVKANKTEHEQILHVLRELKKRPWKGVPHDEAAGQPDLKPEFLTRVYPVFDPDAIEPSVTILKKLLVDDQVKFMEVVKDSIVIQCSDEGHIRAEAYFEAIESAHRRRLERVKPAEPTPMKNE